MVKALFPIGKTQWAKWSDDQRTTFNSLREQGKDFNTAVALANKTQEQSEPEVKATVAPAKKAAPKKKAK
jgi:hypothetical protein